MRLRATVTPTVGALGPFGKAGFTPPAIDNASAFGKFADVRLWQALKGPFTYACQRLLIGHYLTCRGPALTAEFDP